MSDPNKLHATILAASDQLDTALKDAMRNGDKFIESCLKVFFNVPCDKWSSLTKTLPDESMKIIIMAALRYFALIYAECEADK